MATSRFYAAVSGALLGLLAACHQGAGSGSDTQSLDNLARGSGDALTVNDCAGPNALSDADYARFVQNGQIVVESAALEPAVRRALSAVPPSLQRTYFGLGYRLEVSSRALTACQNAGSPRNPYMAVDLSEQSGAKALASCWTHQLLAPGPSGPTPVTDADAAARRAAGDKLSEQITTLIAADQETIAHATLRSLAYAVADRFAYLDYDGQKLNIDLANENPGFAAARETLAVRILEDSHGKPGAFAGSRSLLPSALDTTAKADLAKLWKDFGTTNAEAKRRFENLAFADTMDSYWCSAVTKQKAQAEFPNALAFFDGDLRKNLERLAYDVPQAPAAGLALFDGCGLFGRLCGGGIGSGCGLFGWQCSYDSGGATQDTSGGPFGGCGLFGWRCGGGVGSGCGLFGLQCSPSDGG